jgi:hypothetical protein
VRHRAGEGRAEIPAGGGARTGSPPWARARLRPLEPGGGRLPPSGTEISPEWHFVVEVGWGEPKNPALQAGLGMAPEY